jgi:surface protein
MATFSGSVTQNSAVFPIDLAGSTNTVFAISNPTNNVSYFTLETTRNSDGYYNNQPKNTQGTFTLGTGLSELLQSDYISSVIVQPGGGNLTFVNTNYISGSTLLLRGTGGNPPTLPFGTTWLTSNAGTSNTSSITLPLSVTGTYSTTVNWGDGTYTDISSSTQSTHLFPVSGTYYVYATGPTYKGFRFNNGGDRLKLLNISSWGNLDIDSDSAFYGCSNLTSTAGDAPIISTTSLSQTFRSCSLFNGSIGNWNLPNVTNFSRMFQLCYAFDQNLGSWNMSKATDLTYMFLGANLFTNSNSPSLNSWNVSNVINLTETFRGTSFNQNIGSWDVSKVTNMFGLFYQSNFNNGGSPNINNWNTANVTDLTATFASFSASTSAIIGPIKYPFNPFNQPLDKWNTSKVTTFFQTFAYNNAFNQNIGSWNTSAATAMNLMFFQSTAFNNGGSQSIGNWDVSKVTNFSSSFMSASVFNQPIGTWNVSSSTNMGHMFANATSFDQNLGSWDVRNVTRMNAMFDQVTLSTANYDALLNGWYSLPSLKTNVVFSGGNSKYSSAASASRAGLISTYSWTITDGGLQS